MTVRNFYILIFIIFMILLVVIQKESFFCLFKLMLQVPVNIFGGTMPPFYGTLVSVQGEGHTGPWRLL